MSAPVCRTRALIWCPFRRPAVPPSARCSPIRSGSAATTPASSSAPRKALNRNPPRLRSRVRWRCWPAPASLAPAACSGPWRAFSSPAGACADWMRSTNRAWPGVRTAVAWPCEVHALEGPVRRRGRPGRGSSSPNTVSRRRRDKRLGPPLLFLLSLLSLSPALLPFFSTSLHAGHDRKSRNTSHHLDSGDCLAKIIGRGGRARSHHPWYRKVRPTRS